MFSLVRAPDSRCVLNLWTDKGVVCHGFDIFILSDNISFDKNLVFVSSTSNIVYMWMFQLRSLLMKGVSGVTKTLLLQ